MLGTKSWSDTLRMKTLTTTAANGSSTRQSLPTRHIGNYAAIDVHIRMAPETTIATAHHATREIEDRLRAKFGSQTFIYTHVEPLNDPPLSASDSPTPKA